MQREAYKQHMRRGIAVATICSATIMSAAAADWTKRVTMSANQRRPVIDTFCSDIRSCDRFHARLLAVAPR